MRLFVALVLLAVSLAIAAPARAEDRFTLVRFINTCAGQPASSYVGADLSMNGGPVQDATASFSVTPGRNSFHFTLKPFAGLEDSWIIKEIAQVDSNTNERTVLATPNTISTVLDYAVAEPTLDELVLILEVTADTCARKVKLQIATTVSCTGTNGEDFRVQGGVAVKVGNETYFSNDKGVIEVEVPTGVYDVSASWFDAAYSYVAQNGAPQRNKENGIGAVRLAEKTEMLEVRLATCDPTGREIVRATVTEIDDKATIRVKRSNAEGRAFPGMGLRDGDMVTIKGKAKITWGDGHTITFENPAGVAVIFIGPDKEVPKGTAPPYKMGTVEVLQGLGRFFFPKSEYEGERKFGASSHTVVIAIKGTDFVFGYDPETGQSYVALTEGLVTITPRNPLLPVFDLQPGQEVTIGLGGMTGPQPIGTSTGTGVPVAAVTPDAPGATTAIEPLPPGSYLGCFADTSIFDLDGYLERSAVNTPESCLAICTEKGFKYMGVQYGESCLCGNTYGRYGEVDAAQCNYGCTGRPDTVCGGYNANSIYTTGN